MFLALVLAASPALADDDALFDRLIDPQNAPAAPPEPIHVAPWVDADAQEMTAAIQVPLEAFGEVWAKVKALAAAAEPREQAPAVVLGEARYTGQAVGEALALHLELRVALARPDRWKVVPLVGDDAVVTKASVDGAAIPVSAQGGYHAWVTRRTGPVVIALELLVPARGPRGSIEYDFRVARTPVTQVDVRFGREGLEPRLEAAVQAEVTSADGQTRVTASLEPTTRIRLVGFRDLGADGAEPARLYAETLALMSIDERTVELFAAIRYTILYAGARDFQVLVPPGMEVVSADGRGAFRYTLEPRADGTLLKGETAVPIRDSYEISLRLQRELPAGGELPAPLPRVLGVERDVGWLAIEVPGKLRLAEVSRSDVLAVDTRQLPPELVRSAVSPILKAYRYHAAERRLTLAAERLPEQETASESVDRVRAFSVVSAEGGVLTDLRISLRNRLRHSLALELREGVQVRSAHLDGQPVKPSLDAEGRLLLPLKRSTGRARLSVITLQVVLEEQVGALSWAGWPSLHLPVLELPVSSLAWSVFVPRANLYTALRGDIAPQLQVGRASWLAPLPGPADEGCGDACDEGSGAGHEQEDYEGSDGGIRHSDATPAGGAARGRGAMAHADAGATGSGPGAVADAGAGGGPGAVADAGAMPVRITLPQSGVRLEYERYWLGGGHEVAVSLGFMRRWLAYPLALGAALLIVLGLWLQGGRRLARRLGAGALVAGGAAGWALTGVLVPLAGLALGLTALALRQRWWGRASAATTAWVRSLPARYRERPQPLPAGGADPTPGEAAPSPPRWRRLLILAWQASLAAGLALVAWLLLGKGLALLLQLAGPPGA